MCLAPLAVFLVVFVPSVGHGFLKDDFGWILDSRLTADSGVWHRIVELFTTAHGFYRPVVALTFMANAAVNGTNASAYGMTNLGLAFACVGLIARLGRSLGLPWAAAWFAACLWLMNVHAVPGTVMWISGRTYLLLTIFSAASALLLIKGRLLAAAGMLLVALFTKEEATLLPFILAGWLLVLRPRDRPGLRTWLVASLAMLGLYLAVRSTTSAMTPFDAPSYYHLSYRLGTLLPNVRHYVDFAFTVALSVLLLGWIALGCPRPRFAREDRAAVFCGVIWLLGGFAITIAIPVRSDLYAGFPSVGSCLVFAVVARRLWLSAAADRRQWALASAIVIAVLIGVVDHVRAGRLVRQADPPPGDAVSAPLDATCSGCVTVRLRLLDGRLAVE